MANGLLDFLQGASNSAAANVSAPVDGIAWLLRKAGINVDRPVMGSDWMRERGLTAEPTNKLAGILGESVGGVLPMVTAAKAPQIAQGLLQMADNASTPSVLSKQAGMIKTPFGKIPETEKEVDALLTSLSKQAEKAGHNVELNSSNLSPSRYLTVSSPDREAVQVRISQHGDRYPNTFLGDRFSVDPSSGNTYEMAQQFLKDSGFDLRKKAIKMPDWVAKKPEYASVYPQAVKRLLDSGMSGKEAGFQSALGTEIASLIK